MIERPIIRLDILRLVYRPDRSIAQILEITKALEGYVLGDEKKVEAVNPPAPNKKKGNSGNPAIFQ